MNLLEYEAKAILREYGVPTPSGTVIHAGDSVPPAPIVLKSQVHTGGRGKAGGVRVVTSGNTGAVATDIFALPIKGEVPNTLLAEELVAIQHEYYLSVMVNRSNGTVEIVAHREGGIEVEDHSPEEFFRHELSAESNNTSAIGDTLADYLAIPEKSFVLQELLDNLLNCFNDDVLLLEINPLILTADGKLLAGDCKMTLDDDASYRHNWQFELPPANTNFVNLNPSGTVATIANGAGLAMATVDAVKAASLEPANFLDIGGGATVEGIVKSFKAIMEFPNINAIVINIFGGIVRCDDVAKAILEARKQFPDLPKLYIRLSGTRSEEAALLLASENLTLYPDLPSCLQEMTYEP